MGSTSDSINEALEKLGLMSTDVVTRVEYSNERIAALFANQTGLFLGFLAKQDLTRQPLDQRRGALTRAIFATFKK